LEIAKELVSYGVNPMLSYGKAMYMANGHTLPEEFLNTPVHEPSSLTTYWANRLVEAYDISEAFGMKRSSFVSLLVCH
jgi:hypothetical protein